MVWILDDTSNTHIIPLQGGILPVKAPSNWGWLVGLAGAGITAGMFSGL